jgi:hypothetical protein
VDEKKKRCFGRLGFDKKASTVAFSLFHACDVLFSVGRI